MVAVTLGIVLIALVALDAFETIILPRRVVRRFRLAVLFLRTARFGWNSLARLIRSGASREAFRGYMGPLSLLALLLFWAVLFILGFGLILWGLALPLNAAGEPLSFPVYLYLSSTTFFSLGLGDITPAPGVGRWLIVSEAALGFIFLALVISYIPVLYQAFSRRELRISLLDSRAGSPATAVELLRRNCADKQDDELRQLLHEWEEWSADILESHLSYPILAYYRSQHEQQSWVEALTVILDTCALILTTLDGLPLTTARFSFAMARHAVVDLAQVFDVSPSPTVNRLSPEGFARLQEMLTEAGLRLREGTGTEQELAALRLTYEPFVSALAGFMQVSLPPWIPSDGTLDDWQTSAWDDRFPSIRRTLDQVMRRQTRFELLEESTTPVMDREDQDRTTGG
ncbi:MAG TPA: potassium channel family protein [Anaerolineaceae bacterium]|nr:potassium channel family protein [Anaerolineaceae bacterium]